MDSSSEEALDQEPVCDITNMSAVNKMVSEPEVGRQFDDWNPNPVRANPFVSEHFRGDTPPRMKEGPKVERPVFKEEIREVPMKEKAIPEKRCEPIASKAAMSLLTQSLFGASCRIGNESMKIEPSGQSVYT